MNALLKEARVVVMRLFLSTILAAFIISHYSAAKAETAQYMRSSMGVVNGYAVAVHTGILASCISDEANA